MRSSSANGGTSDNAGFSAMLTGLSTSVRCWRWGDVVLSEGGDVLAAGIARFPDDVLPGEAATSDRVVPDGDMPLEELDLGC